jgi:hypothetical protein
MCECGREQIFYHCYQEECKQLKNFCTECKDEDLHNHSSNIVRCLDLISKSDRIWSLIKERYDNFMIVAKPSYQKVAPLVKYFEAASINVPLNQGGP